MRNKRQERIEAIKGLARALLIVISLSAPAITWFLSTR